MTPFEPKVYGAPLKRLLQEDFRLKVDSRALMCSIMYEINESFVKACVTKTGRSQAISPKFIQESIKNLIPNELRKYAFAAGSNEVFNYSAGLISFRAPKALGIIEQSTIRKVLKELLSKAHSNITLSKQCTTIIGIMQKLTKHLVGRLAPTISHDKEQSLENMRNTLRDMLGLEVFQHAHAHAETNLHWYNCDLLNFPLKRIFATESEEDKIYLQYIKNLASSQFSVTLPKDAALMIYKTMRQTMTKMVGKANQNFETSTDGNNSVTYIHMLEVLKKMFPQNKYFSALAQAQANVMNYSCGFLKYDYGRVAEVESLEKVPSLIEVLTQKTITINFRAGVRPLMQDLNFLSGIGSLKLLNDILNDVTSEVVQKCSQLENSDVITGNHVVMAASEVLPEELRDHAFARIDFVKNHVSLPRKVLSQLYRRTEGRKQEARQRYESGKDSSQLSRVASKEFFSEPSTGISGDKFLPFKTYPLSVEDEKFYMAIDYREAAAEDEISSQMKKNELRSIVDGKYASGKQSRKPDSTLYKTKDRKYAVENERQVPREMGGKKWAVEDKQSPPMLIKDIPVPDTFDQKHANDKKSGSKEMAITESEDANGQNRGGSDDTGKSWYAGHLFPKSIFWLDVRPYEFL